MIDSMLTIRRRDVLGRICVSVIAFCLWSSMVTSFSAQESSGKGRLNRLVAALEQGKPAYFEDWQWIDMMRSPFLLDQLFERLKDLRANGRSNLTPIVRIPMEGDEDFRWAVGQVLDMGAFGIAFPAIETKEEALKAIEAMRYPQLKDTKYPQPRGRRQHGAPSPRAAEYWGLSTEEYVRRADVWPLNPNGELFTMLMIPTNEGIKNINDILKVPGIGGVLIGPGELAASIGVRPGTPEVEAAIQTILRACIANKVFCGMSGVNDDAAAKKWISQGFKILTKSSTPVWLR